MAKFKDGDRVRINGNLARCFGQVGAVWGYATNHQQLNAVSGPIYAVELDEATYLSVAGVTTKRILVFERQIDHFDREKLVRQLREAKETVAAIRRQLGDD